MLSRFPAQSTLCCLLLAVPALHAEKPRKPVPPLAAAQYSCHDSHQRVTIAAEPGDTKQTRPDTRLDYYAHGLLPVRVIVTNDTDRAVTLDDARIHFVTADNVVLQAATLDDLQRRMFTMKGATGTKVPLPLPIPIPITVGKKNVDKKIQQDDDDFSFQTTTVKPHSTVAGYLYYDISDVPEPALQNATLELRKVRFSDDTSYLDSFEIALHPTARAQAQQ